MAFLYHDVKNKGPILVNFQELNAVSKEYLGVMPDTSAVWGTSGEAFKKCFSDSEIFVEKSLLGEEIQKHALAFCSSAPFTVIQGVDVLETDTVANSFIGIGASLNDYRVVLCAGENFFLVATKDWDVARIAYRLNVPFVFYQPNIDLETFFRKVNRGLKQIKP